jgi:hypothetical protein
MAKMYKNAFFCYVGGERDWKKCKKMHFYEPDITKHNAKMTHYRCFRVCYVVMSETRESLIHVYAYMTCGDLKGSSREGYKSDITDITDITKK